nr:PREDICTED: sorting nexin-14 [Lepisosteus oculatus]
MSYLRAKLENLKQKLKVDLFREVGRQYPVFCFILVFLLISTVILNRYLHILMVFWSFLAGIVTFYCSLGPESLLPNIIFKLKPKNKQEQQELFPLGHSCAVCGKIKCKRHRPTLLLENYQPWLDLKVYSKVDASVSEVLELVLENFVYPWYRDVTDDEAFVDELRVTLRFFAAVLVRRVQKVDVPSLITRKLLKVAMKHIEIIAKARQKVKNPEHVQQAALEEYGPDLHVALRTRRDELVYLRKLTEMLFPYILPPKATDCRSLTLLIREVLAGSVFLPAMDFLADPDTVNHLILIFIDDSLVIAEGSYVDVVKLQTMRCLFEAYEHVLSLLENVFTPMFCHSDEYFRHLLRGAESPARNSKLSRNSLSLDDIRNTSKRGETFGISRIGSKIKGVFKSTTMEGAMLPSSGLAEGEDDMVEEATMVMEDDSPVEAISTPSTPRNLSAWKITIPYVDLFDDELKKERFPVFCIDVERNDRKAGSCGNCSLSLHTYIEPRTPVLQDSNDNHIDKAARSANVSEEILVFQKGQHLEPFILSFFNSCESPKPKPSRPELTILSPTSENNKKLFNDLFKNNAGRSEKKYNQNCFMEKITVEGVYDYLMYIGRVVFHIPDWLHHLLTGGRILFKNTLEAYTDYYLQYKLDQVLQEHRVVSLITLLRDAVFCENSEPRSFEDKQKRAKKTFEEMMNYIPDFLGKCIGEEAKYEGIRLLFDGLQQPILNKQLTYVLLDIAVQELFPELNKVPNAFKSCQSV